MNRNHAIGFAAAAAILGVLAFAAWSLFEVRPSVKYLPPSREAGVNEYLAFDRWLAGMGHSVRTENSGDLSLVARAKENRIFIQSSLFQWTNEAAEYLVRWVEEGGSLFLSLDDFLIGDYWEGEGPLLLLEAFGVAAEAGDGPRASSGDPGSPDYDASVFFAVAENAEALVMKDGNGAARLARVKRGRGTFTVSGRPYFLLSANLENAANARLAWALFAEGVSHNGKESFFFIRGTARVRGILGSLFRNGNLAVLAVSFFVLLVICFWAAIPGFGAVRGDEERPGKALRERFLAEGRFLKRYGALGFYRDLYIKEIARQISRKEGVSGAAEINARVTELWEKAEGRKDLPLLARTLNRDPFRYRDFSKMILILMRILERIWQKA